MDSSIDSLSIRDHYRLGKFKQDQPRPRPTLVKLNRTSEVATIISKARQIDTTPYIIKQDLTLSERQMERALLKERWNLIQSGVSRTDIKLRGSFLYVKRKLYGQYKQDSFKTIDNHDPPLLPNPLDPNLPDSAHVLSPPPPLPCST